MMLDIFNTLYLSCGKYWSLTVFRENRLYSWTEENIIDTKNTFVWDLTCLLATKLQVQTEKDVNASDINPSAILRTVNCWKASDITLPFGCNIAWMSVPYDTIFPLRSPNNHTSSVVIAPVATAVRIARESRSLSQQDENRN